MKKVDLVYTLAKAGYGKEEIAKLMEGEEAPAESAAPVVQEAPAAPAVQKAPAAPEAPAAPNVPAAPVDAPSSHDELMALRNRLKVLETVLSVSNTDNVDSLASIVYPKGE